MKQSALAWLDTVFITASKGGDLMPSEEVARRPIDHVRPVQCASGCVANIHGLAISTDAGA